MFIHGWSKTPTYKTWVEMRQRCGNPKSNKYKWYGARGIGVHPAWDSFENFLRDMGERPSGMTLDRLDNNGNYGPGNCKWATKIQQMNNMRTNRIVTVSGTKMTMAEASRKWKVPVRTLWARLNAGWDEEDAVKRSVRRHKVYEWTNRALGKL